MALDVGSVFATVGAKFEDAGFDRWEKRYKNVKQDASKGAEAKLSADANVKDFDKWDKRLKDVKRDAVKNVDAKLGADTKAQGFERFERHLRDAKGDARKGATAKLDAKVDTRGFDKYDRAAKQVHRDNEDMVRGSARVRTGFASIFFGGGLFALGATAAYGLGKSMQYVGQSFGEADKVAAQTHSVLKSTGNVANVTAKEIGALAGELSRKSGIDDEAIQSGENLLLTFTNIRNETGKGNDIFNQATTSITDMSAALGQDFKSSAIQLGKALNDPIKGVTALQRVGVSFDKSTKEQITTLVESGKTLTAQKIILKELTKEFGGSAEAAGKTLPGALGRMKVALGNAAETLGAKLAPSTIKAANSVAKFVDQMQKGEGAGGRFVDRMRAVAERIGQVVSVGARFFRWLTQTTTGVTVLGGVIGGLIGRLGGLAGAWAVGKIAGFVNGIKLAGGALAALRVAIASNPIGLLLTAIGAAAGAFMAFNWIQEKTKVSAQEVTDALRAQREAVQRLRDLELDAAQAKLNVRNANVAVERSELAAAEARRTYGKRSLEAREAENGLKQSRIDQQRAVRDLRRFEGEGNDRRRETIETTNHASKSSRGRIDTLKDEIKGLQGARKAMEAQGASAKDLNKITDALAGEKLRERKAMDDSGKAAKQGGKAYKVMAGSADNLSEAVGGSAEQIARDTNELLKEFGAKPLKYKPSRKRVKRNIFSGPGGEDYFAPEGKAEGGWIGNIGERGQDAVHAVLGRGEAVLNHFQQPFVQMGLSIAKMMGASPYGSLQELFAGEGRPHGFAQGGIVGIPGEPGESIHRSILPDVLSLKRRYKLDITDGYATSGHAPGGEHPKGLAIDAVPGQGGSWDKIDQLNAWAQTQLGKVFRWIGYDGVPGHGRGNHIHLSWLAGKSFGGEGGGGLENLKKIIMDGPAGALLNIGQGAADKLTGAGNKFLDRRLAETGGGPGDMHAAPTTGGMSKAQIKSLWVKAGGSSEKANLMAAIALAESGGRPSIVNSIGAGGLWQIHPPEPNYLNPLANARMAVRKLKSQGLGAWEAYTKGMHTQYLAKGGFAGGGGHGRPSASHGPTHPGQASQQDRHKGVAAIQRNIDKLGKDYDLNARRFDLSEEVFIVEHPGDGHPVINESAVNKRLAELRILTGIREKIRRAYGKMIRLIERLIATYKNMHERIQAAIRHVRAALDRLKGKKGKQAKSQREGLSHRLEKYKEKAGDYRGKIAGLVGDLDDASFEHESAGVDIAELGKEVQSLQPKALAKALAEATPAPDKPDAPDASTGGTDAPDTPTATDRPPTAEEISKAAAQQLAAFNQQRLDLFKGFGANFVPAGQPFFAPGDVGAAAAGLRAFGAFGGGAFGGDALRSAGGGGRHIEIVNHFAAPPPDPHTWAQQQRFSVEAAL